MSTPRWLYLHGFASGPQSTKGVFLRDHYARAGVKLDLLDLRKPSLEHLRLSAILDEVRGAMGGARDRCVVFGSSLGGLAAARIAEEDPRVFALVLLAPAFRMVDRWRARIGAAAWERWRTTGWFDTYDYALKRPARVDFGFMEDAAPIDERSGGWPDVRVPTLVIHGRKDDTVDVALSREWARGKRHVRLLEVDDGHELRDSLPLIAREADAFLAPLLGRVR